MTGLVLACGALARELKAVLGQATGGAAVELRCLPADLHNRPERIAPRVEVMLAGLYGRYDPIFVAYADCGSGGELDRVLARYPGVERLPGAHCYAVMAGEPVIEELLAQEPGTFLLTDFMVRHFERLVIRGLGIDRHPELLPMYFGNYRRVVYLAQQCDPALEQAARAAAARLGLEFETRFTGYGGLQRVALASLGRAA